MSVEIRQLKDKGTGTPFVPITHWDAVGGKPNVATMSDVTNGLATKQDILTAGDYIEIDSAGTINVTGITGAVEEDIERMSQVISMHINSLTDRATALETNADRTSQVVSMHINSLTDRVDTIDDDLEEITYVTSLQLNNLTDRATALETNADRTSQVVSMHINSLTDRVTTLENSKQDVLTAGDNIEIDSAGTISCTITSTSQLDNDSDFIVGEELSYSEHALYYSGDDVVATGMVSRVGSVVSLFVAHADVVDGWRDIYYRLPYEPASGYTAIINSCGIYESNNIHYKLALDYQTVGSVVYPVLRLNHYINGEIANWEYGQVISFKVDYITSE